MRPRSPQSFLQEELDHSVYDNLLGKRTSNFHERNCLFAVSFSATIRCLVIGSPHSSSAAYLRMNFMLVLNAVCVSKCTTTRECSFFKSGALNVMGDQAVPCPAMGDMVAHHNCKRDKIRSSFSSAHLSPTCEQKIYYPTNQDRARYSYPLWKVGQPAALDVSVTFPLQPIGGWQRRRRSVILPCQVPRTESTNRTPTVRKALKRNASLDDTGSFQSAELSLAFSKLSQPVSCYRFSRVYYFADCKRYSRC